jgi:DNA replication ATP-dependent helicase Dna2
MNNFEKMISDGLVVDTIHSFQGNEKGIIIISLVESDCNRKIFSDIRILNVAITRAKYKLIIIGSKKLAESKSRTSNGFKRIINSAALSKSKSNSGFVSGNVLETSQNAEIIKKSKNQDKIIDTISELERERKRLGLPLKRQY